MKRYNVLWIDDEFEKQDGFIDSAYLRGIDLACYKTSIQGMEELESKIEQYDAVILDAMVYFESEDETANLTGLLNSIKNINSLSRRKKIPYFIFSGYIDEDRHSSVREMLENESIFIKSKNNDELFKAIITAADKQIDTQIRHKYEKIFNVCTEEYIGENAGLDLLNLLLKIEDSNTENQFNTIRKIVEDIFISFNKFHLLPNEFVMPSLSINESSKFLSGKNHKGELFTEKGYKHLEDTHISPQISAMLWSIISITQDGSHRANIDKHVKMLKTSYLIQSVLNQLFDVIIWFKIYVDSHPQTKNWIKIENSTEVNNVEKKRGKVINLDQNKGFAFFEPDDKTENVFIPPHLVINNQLKESDIVEVEIEEYIDNRTGNPKKRVCILKKL